MKRFLKRALNDTSAPLFFWVSDFLAVITILSIVSIVLETVESLSVYQNWFYFIEWGTAIIFSLEYLARLYITSPKRSYVLSWFGIIDLLAIVPTFLGIGNLTFLKSARALRIIRLLRLLRLAKMSRSNLVDEKDLSILSFNVLIYLITLVFALLITGTAMYLIEPDLSAFSSIPAGMWWSFKVFLGSILVAQPETTLGQVFHVVTRFAGLLLLGLLLGVVGNIFKGVFEGRGR